MVHTFRIRNMGRHIRTTLLAGLLVIIPAGVTFLILKTLFGFFDPLLKPLFEGAIDRYTPGMGIIALLIIIYVIGLITTHVLGRRIIRFGQELVERVPVVSGVYRAARQATEVLSNVQANGKFSSVVLVDFPGHGLKSIGLVTSKIKDKDGNTLLAVYMPTSPFPTSGFLVLLPENQVTPTDIQVDDAMKLIVSAGVIAPEQIKSYPNPLVAAPTMPWPPPLPPQGEELQAQDSDGRASNQ